MNRLAAQPVATIVAKLDLSNEGQRRLHDFFRRMHTGRWPTLRTVALRQMEDGSLLEVAEWLRGNPRYCVVTWGADGDSWACEAAASHRVALAKFNALPA